MVRGWSRAIWVLTLAGCAGMDPWGALDRSPGSPASPYAFSAEGREIPPLPSEFKGRRLTLARCISIALERNPETRASWESAKSAAARVGEEKAAYLPSVDFVAGGSRSDTPEFRDKNESPKDDFSAGFGVRYLLFDGGLRYARVRGAEAGLLAANFRHNAVLQDVALTVELTYHERLAAEALIRVAQDTVRQRQVHLDLARARLRSGVVAKFDVLKAETEKADADLVLVRARSGVRITQGRLARSMGVRVTESFEIEDLPQEVHRQELEDLDRLLEEAAGNRPELHVAAALVEARRADIQAVRSEYLPTLTAGADYGWRDTEFLPDREEWFVGVGVSLPLFLGFGRGYRVRRAAAELSVAVASRDSLLRNIELEVWTAHSRLTEAGEAIGAAEKLVASAQESARVAEGRYRSGVGDIIELVDSLTARTEARTQRVRVTLDWYTAVSRFQRAAGRRLAGGDR